MLPVAVSADTLKKQISDLGVAADEIGRTRQAITTQYQQLGYQWNDSKYKALGDIVRESNASLRNIEKIFLQSQRALLQILSAVTEYEQTSLNGTVRRGATSEGYSRRLSPDEVNARWQSGVDSINEQIANYKEALLARGVPECAWLNRTLAQHRAAMLEQEGFELDAASGQANDTTNDGSAYRYPGDYAAFYDQLAAEFQQYCLSGTNPRYHDAPEWRDNCQRCVPTCELRRRGNEFTVRPSTYGSTHLVYRPFDVWESAEIQSSTGNGMQTIQNSMADWGDGSRAQVVVYWDSPLGGGHTFMAEQRNGATAFFDPQTGNSDCASYFDRVLDGRTQFSRIDNLQFSSYIEDCYMEVG